MRFPHLRRGKPVSPFTNFEERGRSIRTLARQGTDEEPIRFQQRKARKNYSARTRAKGQNPHHHPPRRRPHRPLPQRGRCLRRSNRLLDPHQRSPSPTRRRQSPATRRDPPSHPPRGDQSHELIAQHRVIPNSQTRSTSDPMAAHRAPPARA